MKKFSREECLETLGIVPEDFTPEAARKAYKQLALRWHPDKNGNSKESNRKFKEISLAYKQLSRDDFSSSDEECESDEDDFFPMSFFAHIFGQAFFKGSSQPKPKGYFCKGCGRFHYDDSDDENESEGDEDEEEDEYSFLKKRQEQREVEYQRILEERKKKEKEIDDAWNNTKSEIIDAVRANNTQKLKTLLQKTPDLLQTRNIKGNTPLHFAARFGTLNAAQVIMSQPNSDSLLSICNHLGQTPLQVATKYNQQKISNWLETQELNRSERVAAQLINEEEQKKKQQEQKAQKQKQKKAKQRQKKEERKEKLIEEEKKKKELEEQKKKDEIEKKLKEKEEKDKIEKEKKRERAKRKKGTRAKGKGERRKGERSKEEEKEKKGQGTTKARAY